MNVLNQQELKRLMSYDPVDGKFRWKLRPNNRIHIGDVAGSMNGCGYIGIRINGVQHKAHRLAWLYMTGELPAMQVDHCDGNKINNSWKNLRLATPAQNMQNRGVYSHNTRGYKGVSFHRKSGRWRASIRKDGRTLHLGSFQTREAAAEAYQQKAKELHGAFARF